MAQNTQQGGRDEGGRDQGSSNRGFASMDDDKQRSIAAEGGHAAHAQGTAHEFTSDEAREAGRKGGQSRASGGSESDRDMLAGASGSGSNRGQQTQGLERDEDGQSTSGDRGGSSSGRNSGSEDGRGGRAGGRGES